MTKERGSKLRKVTWVLTMIMEGFPRFRTRHIWILIKKYSKVVIYNLSLVIMILKIKISKKYKHKHSINNQTTYNNHKRLRPLQWRLNL
jgi:hypothetical protein